MSAMIAGSPAGERSSVLKETRPSVSKETRHIAIVGCGPRGLQCLETLSRKLAPHQLAATSVTVYETAEHLGAGCVYDPSQPHELRMNFASQHIDFWKYASQQRIPASTSLLVWLSEHYPHFAKSDQYLPRAVVGEYLSECAIVVLRRFHPDQVQIVRDRVVRIEKVSTGWRVVDSNDGDRPFDQVVLTTGHEGLRKSDQLDGGPRHTFVLPSQQTLSTSVVPAMSRVLIRGFGLTAIDAVLSLTEGRGGRFGSGASLPSYRPDSDDVRSIEICSRSGRPMLAKPTAAIEPISKSFWQPFRRRLDRLHARHGDLRFRADIWQVLLHAAGELLTQCDQPIDSREIDDWYRAWSRYKMDESHAIAVMSQSLMVATGECPKDIAYALGETWRKLYPEITRLVQYGGLADGHWQTFLSISREMERIAFGPPAESVSKLICLTNNNVVKLRLSVGERRKEADSFDQVVDAVIAGPHQARPGGPIEGLIQDGQIVVDEVTGAVKVDENGFAIGPHAGLAIFGRATEGWVVGNDTLNRTLHNHMERWGDRIATEVP